MEENPWKSLNQNQTWTNFKSFAIQLQNNIFNISKNDFAQSF